MKSNVCVLGAGRMGSSIVRTLLDRGYPTSVWNRTAAKSEPLAALGAKVAASVEDGVGAAEVVIVNVLDYAASKTLLRSDNVASALVGRTIVQLTSGSPRLAREEAQWVEARGAGYLDGAIMATPDFIGRPETTLLYSGSREVYDRHEPLLLELGGGTGYVGEVAGQASALDTALLTQMWGGLFGTLQGMAVAEAEGLDLLTFRGHLAAFKPVVDAALFDVVDRTKAHRFAGDEATLASLGAHYSAFRHLLEACEERGLSAAMPRAMDQIFQKALSLGSGTDDFASLFPLFQNGSVRQEGKPAHA
ncbi:NAD(P)-dependent oxidoreductase [Aminobacter sp. MET-1]|uniref:NAD(P)-dependent oxidoreductase n=1 Tax=Aminobacter sp. MET-1 TaxID=2951085 RepID=UPI00226AEF24|nr:NAD(P)-binding domain-containing protein [Aminobacter sp. MET-1]MCX8569920.1 NAD(P)-binding domain-containing protein [Aminobacter sp. MET-1]